MSFRVDAGRLPEAAGPLRSVAQVARVVPESRAGLAAQLAHLGSVPLQRATAEFLDGWAAALAAVAERADALAGILETALAACGGADERTREPAGHRERDVP